MLELLPAKPGLPEDDGEAVSVGERVVGDAANNIQEPVVRNKDATSIGQKPIRHNPQMH